MADLKRTIEIVLAGTNQLGDMFGKASDDLEKMAVPLDKVAERLVKTEAAALAMGAAIGGIAINEAGKFYDATAEISTLISTTPEQFAEFKNSILDYASGSTQSLEAINQSLYNAISAGADWTKSIELLGTAEKLAVGGKADLNQSITVLLSSLNAYGAGLDEATDYSNVLFTAVRTGQTTLPQLAGALSQITGIASQAGVPFADLNAAVAGLTAATGQGTSTAVASLKAALSGIISPTAEAAETAKSLGIEFSASALKADGLQNFLNKLYTATGGNIETMAKLFGSTEALNTVMVLGADASGKFEAAMQGMRERAGATEAAFNKMADNVALANQSLVNSIQTVLVDVGGRLLEQYGRNVDALGEVFQGLRIGVNDGAFDSVFEVLNEFGRRAEELLRGIGKNLPEALGNVDFSGLSQSLRGLRDSIGGAFDGLDLSTPEGLTRAIQGLVNIFTTLTNTVGGIADAWAPLGSVLTNVATSFNGLGTSNENLIGKMLGYATMVKMFGTEVGVLAALMDQLGISGQTVADILLGAAEMAAGGINAIAQTANMLKEAVLIVIDTIIASIGSGVESLLSILAAITPDALGGAKIQEWADTVGGVVEGAKARIEQNAGDIGNSFQNIVNNDTALTGFNRLMGGVERGFNEISSSAKKTADTVEPSIRSGIILPFGEVETAADDSAGAVAEMGNKTGAALATVAQSGELVTKSAQDAHGELSKLANDQKIKSIEAQINLQTEKVKGDVEIAKSAFESLGKTVEATGQGIAAAFGAFENADFAEQDWIRETIDKQIANQTKATDAQVKLVETQIDRLKAETEALQRGDALIKIESDGLEPEIEAFMIKILERIKLRADTEGQSLLLGMGV